MKTFFSIIYLLSFSTLTFSCSQSITDRAIEDADYYDLALEISTSKQFSTIPETEEVFFEAEMKLQKGEHEIPDNVLSAISFEFSEADILKISQSGKVMPLNIGKTKVSAFYTSKGQTFHSNSIEFEVKAKNLDLSISSDAMLIYVVSYKDEYLTPEFKIDGMARTEDFQVLQNIIYHYSNASIISIDSMGKITGLNPGTTSVTAIFIYEEYELTSNTIYFEVKAEDTIANTVKTTSPAGNEVEVNAGIAQLELTFENPEDPGNLDLLLNTLLDSLTCDNDVTVTATVWDFDNKTAIFPIDTLHDDIQTYTCVISGITDLSGNIMPDYSWSFTTRDANPPVVVKTTPENGVINGAIGVSRSINKISIQFNEAMNLTSLENALSADNGVQFAASPTWNSSTNTATYAVEIDPDTNSECSNFNISLSGEITDSAPIVNKLNEGSSYNWIISPKPCVESVTPTMIEQNGVDPNTYQKNIQISFNENIIIDDWLTQVKISQGADNLSITNVSVNNNVVSITLTGILELLTTYTITLDKTLRNYSNFPIEIDYNYNITTGKYIDNLDGTIYDPAKNLTWMKCSQGQTWSGSETNTCEGNTSKYAFCNNSCTSDCSSIGGGVLTGEYSNGGYSEAWESCQSLNAGSGYAGKTIWRVPIITELESLVEYERSPKINLIIFPNTPSGSTSYYSATAGGACNYAGHIWFVNGNTIWTGFKDAQKAIRCVSTGP